MEERSRPYGNLVRWCAIPGRTTQWILIYPGAFSATGRLSNGFSPQLFTDCGPYVCLFGLRLWSRADHHCDRIM